jgi:hypothetical protein
VSRVAREGDGEGWYYGSLAKCADHPRPREKLKSDEREEGGGRVVQSYVRLEQRVRVCLLIVTSW